MYSDLEVINKPSNNTSTNGTNQLENDSITSINQSEQENILADADDSITCSEVDQTTNENKVLDSSAISVDDDTTHEDTIGSESCSQTDDVVQDTSNKLEDTLDAVLGDVLSSTTNEGTIDANDDERTIDESELLASSTLDVDYEFSLLVADKETDSSVVQASATNCGSPTKNGSLQKLNGETTEPIEVDSQISNSQAKEDQEETINPIAAEIKNELCIVDSMNDNVDTTQTSSNISAEESLSVIDSYEDKSSDVSKLKSENVAMNETESIETIELSNDSTIGNEKEENISSATNGVVSEKDNKSMDISNDDASNSNEIRSVDVANVDLPALNEVQVGSTDSEAVSTATTNGNSPNENVVIDTPPAEELEDTTETSVENGTSSVIAEDKIISENQKCNGTDIISSINVTKNEEISAESAVESLDEEFSNNTKIIKANVVESSAMSTASEDTVDKNKVESDITDSIVIDEVADSDTDVTTVTESVDISSDSTTKQTDKTPKNVSSLIAKSELTTSDTQSTDDLDILEKPKPDNSSATVMTNTSDSPEESSSLKRKLSSDDLTPCPSESPNKDQNASTTSTSLEPLEKRVRTDSDVKESTINTVDEDDDIVVIGEVAEKPTEDTNIPQSNSSLKRTHSNTSLDSAKKQKTTVSTTQGAVSTTIVINDIKPITLEPKPEVVTVKRSIPLEFMRSFKKSFSSMTRSDMEEFFLQKVVEAIVNKSEIAELRQTVEEQETALTTFRAKIMELSKQFRDLEMVHLRVMKDLDANNGQLVTPVKITRAVGLQVMLPRKEMMVKAGQQQITSNTSSKNSSTTPKTATPVSQRKPSPLLPAPTKNSQTSNQSLPPNHTSQQSLSQQSPLPQQPTTISQLPQLSKQKLDQQRALQQTAKAVADARKIIQDQQRQQQQQQKQAAVKQLYQVQQQQLQQQRLQQNEQLLQQNASAQRKIGPTPSSSTPNQLVYASRKSLSSTDSNGSTTAKSNLATPTAPPRVPPVILKKMSIPAQHRNSIGTPSTGSPVSSTSSASGPAYTIAVVPQSKLMQQQSTPPSSSSGANTIDLTDEEDQTKGQQYRRIKPNPSKPPAKNHTSSTSTPTSSNGKPTKTYPTTKAQVANLQKLLQKATNSPRKC